MKNLSLLLFGSLLVLSCNKQEITQSPNQHDASLTALNSFLGHTEGMKIYQFVEDGVDKTSQFSQYLFNFQSNGTVTATSGSISFNGSFLVFEDDGQTELQMTFPSSSALFELTDDWYFIQKDAQTIKFEDMGDIIIFEKQ